MAGVVRVVLVDDHPAILDAVGGAVTGAPDLELAGTARSLGEALALLTASDDVCEVVVSDVQLAGEAEGLRLLEALGSDGPAVLLLSSFDQPPLIRTAFERGADRMARSIDAENAVPPAATVRIASRMSETSLVLRR